MDCKPEDRTIKSNSTLIALECPSSSYFLDLIIFFYNLGGISFVKLCAQCNDLKTNKKLMFCFQIAPMFGQTDGVQTNLTFERNLVSTCHTISMDLDIVNGRCKKTDTDEEVCGIHFKWNNPVALITDPIPCSPKTHSRTHSRLSPPFWVLVGCLIVALIVAAAAFVMKRWKEGHNYKPENNFSFVVLE